MAELWPFENVGCTYVTLVTLVTLVTTESSSKSKLIWPMNYFLFLGAKNERLQKIIIRGCSKHKMSRINYC